MLGKHKFSTRFPSNFAMSLPIKTLPVRVTGPLSAFYLSTDSPLATAPWPTAARQILSFQIAGDFMDLQSFTLNRLDHSIVTLTASRVATFSHSSIADLIVEPSLARLLWHETLVEAAIFREWIVNVGRRNAYQRVAHVLCELVTRMEAVGLARDGICDLPLTQSELADATGLSTVHVNRVIQELRRENLITLRSRTFSALNWSGLKIAAEFDATYLQLGGPELNPAE